MFQAEVLLAMVILWTASNAALWNPYDATEVTIVDAKPECKESDLHIAVLLGDVGRVVELVQEGSDLYANDCQGRTPMHLAILQDDARMVSALLGYGFNPNKRLENGTTVLFFAAAQGAGKSVVTLVAGGAYADLVDYNNSTALLEAAFARRFGIAVTLISLGANVGKILPGGNSYVHRASQLGDVEIVKFFVEQGSPMDLVNLDGETPLSIAVQRDAVDIAKVLLSNGANVTRLLFEEGETYAYIAVRRRCTASLWALMKNGLNADAHNLYGDTPIQLAIYQDDVPTAKLLYGFGADLEQRWFSIYGTGNMTLLNWAAVWGSEKSVSWLIENGLSVNVTDSDLSLPLHYAANYRHLEVVKELVESGSCINCRESFHGYTPLYLAQYYPEIAEYLRSKGGILGPVY